MLQNIRYAKWCSTKSRYPRKAKICWKGDSARHCTTPLEAQRDAGNLRDVRGLTVLGVKDVSSESTTSQTVLLWKRVKTTSVDAMRAWRYYRKQTYVQSVPASADVLEIVKT